MAIRLLPDCIQLLFTHTYSCVTFLIIYGTMWVLNMNFDISFFAVVTSLLGYLELSVMDFGMCIRNLVNYLIAAKRIQVSRYFSIYIHRSIMDDRISYFLGLPSSG